MQKETQPILDKFGYRKAKLEEFKKALIRIKPSKILEDSIGVFAIRELKKGTLIGEVVLLNENLFFTWEDFKKFDKKSQEMVMRFCIGAIDGFYAPADINHISIPWHVNHCCDGNIGFDVEGNFITLRDVSADEELCYDYGLAISNPNYKLDCKCGTPKCRGVVTGNDWKDSEYRKNNFEYMLPELKEYMRLIGIHN